MWLILFIVCNTQDDSVFYNIVRSAMAVNSFHDQIINFSWLNSCISPYYFYGDFLYFLKHMYIKITGYFIFLLQFVRVFRKLTGLRVFNATFNNISAISWRSVLLVVESGVPGENHRPVASHWQTLSHKVASSTPRLSGVRLVMIQTVVSTIYV